MRKTFSSKWTSLALLSIIVPVSLLATFRLTGVLPEPPKTETITVGTVSWNMSRPAKIITIDKWVKNSYAEEAAFINFSIHFQEYIENKLDWPSDGDDDVINLGVAASANVTGGFIHSLVIEFSKTDGSSILHISRDSRAIRLDNLKLESIRSHATDKKEAYFETTGLNQPKNCSLRMLTFWILQDKNNLDHQATITLEATYYNGIAWRKIEIPIQLGVVAD